MRLYLIRHGETDWNRDRKIMGLEPLPLNDLGRERVETLGRYLKGFSIPVVFTSTVVRARETADILASCWNARLVEEPRFNESPYEKWVGMKYSELRGDPEFELYGSRPSRARFSESEDMAGIQKRALEGVERIRAESNGECAAAVSHSDVIKPVVAHYLGMSLDSIHSLGIANASATLLDFGFRVPRVVFMNIAPWKWLDV
jgi:broad specificity phosphatase PhoE